MKRGCHAYQAVNTMGMSQLDLILVVYRGTVQYLIAAKEAFRRDDSEAARQSCEKARTCLVHLYTTLDAEQGGMIAQNLGRLYAHMIERLDQAVAGRSEPELDGIIALMNTIREGWEGLKGPDSPGAGADSSIASIENAETAYDTARLTVTA